MAKTKRVKNGARRRSPSPSPVADDQMDERGLSSVFLVSCLSVVMVVGLCFVYSEHVGTAAEDVATTLLTPELHTALHEGWESVKNGLLNIVAHLHLTPPADEYHTEPHTEPEAATEPQEVSAESQPHSENQPHSEQQSVPEKTVKESAKKEYAKVNITNSVDNKIRKELDRADRALEKGDVNGALTQFEEVLQRYPRSPRAQFGKAQSLNVMAEYRRSNTILEQAIEECLKVLQLDDVPKELLIKTGTLCADRLSFRGFSRKALNTLRFVVDRYPSELSVWNDLGVKGLLAGQQEEARRAFKEVLRHDSKNGFAMVHLGFIVKTGDRDYAGAIPLLRDGIATDAPGVIDGRFFFHLGDALFRTGQHEEAHAVYEKGASYGLFLSAWQRSLYNVDRLESRPWWTVEQTHSASHFKLLEDNWEEIRDEGLANMNDQGLFEAEAEDLRHTGDWKQFTLYQQGRKNVANCQKAPRTCSLVEKFSEATSCKRGQIKFSVMHPVAHVWPHTGPTNCRIRSHLGLVVPPGPRIRVANDTRGWQEGKIIVFDDSFEHEVWHDGNSLRLVLILDIWHPDLTPQEKATLTAI